MFMNEQHFEDALRSYLNDLSDDGSDDVYFNGDIDTVETFETADIQNDHRGLLVQCWGGAEFQIIIVQTEKDRRIEPCKRCQDDTLEADLKNGLCPDCVQHLNRDWLRLPCACGIPFLFRIPLKEAVADVHEINCPHCGAKHTILDFPQPER